MREAAFVSSCPCCGGKAWDLLHDGRIRDGSFGKVTETPVRIYQCKLCKLARLEKFILGARAYESTDYREKYNDSSDDKILLSMHDPEQGARVALIGFERLRDKVIVDYGCGHGAFLDAVAGVARVTIGIEPLKVMRPSLEKRGHIVYGGARDALTEYRGKVDVVASFGVIEHVDDPMSYLKDAFDMLTDGGCLVLQTDNLDDILMVSKAKGFPEFFFRTAHNWYFLPSNMEMMIRGCGFEVVKTMTTHGYDFSNFLLWHKEGRPTGVGKMPLFDSVFEKLWVATVEKAGHGDLITLFAKKPSQ